MLISLKIDNKRHISCIPASEVEAQALEIQSSWLRCAGTPLSAHTPDLQLHPGNKGDNILLTGWSTHVFSILLL